MTNLLGQPNHLKRLSAHFRMAPSFIIIGAMKAGTTSLYSYLYRHPDVIQPYTKEIHFFSLEFEAGYQWYRSHFPLSVKRFKNHRLITGEASTSYLADPYAPTRIAKTFPDIKLIALLRNPVDRAYSHYMHERKYKRESLTFEKAIEYEINKIESDISQKNRTTDGRLDDQSYVSMGIYIDQLKRWFNHFDKEQILVLRSEDLYSDTSKIYHQSLDFLNLPSWEPHSFKIFNSGIDKSPMDSLTRSQLLTYYKPYNNKLYEYLNRDFGWDS